MGWDAAPRVIGHRGSPGLAVENTLASFTRAVEAGADGVELDARLSRDGVVVVHHDEELGRTVGGSGPVSSMDADALGALGVPRLRDVLRAVPSVLVDIELKPDGQDAERLPGAVAEVVRAEGALDRVLGTSFDPALAEAYAEATGGMAGAILPFPLTPEDLVEWPRLTHVCLVEDACLPEVVGPLLAAGMVVHAWTVNDEAAAARLWGMGVAAVITDRPGALARARPRRGGAARGGSP